MLGSNFLPLHDFESSVDVSVWDTSAGSAEFLTIYGAIAYDHPISDKLNMLVYHQSINFPRLENYLMFLMHSWMSGVRINDISKPLAEDTDENTHFIIVDDPLNPNEPLIIPLVLKEVTSYLSSRKPKKSEYGDNLIPHIDMTSKAPAWKTSDTSFSDQEAEMTDLRGLFISSENITRGQRIINYISICEDDVVDFTDDENFFNALNDKVNVDRVESSKRRHGVTSKSLSQKLLIFPDSERRTEHNSTQRGIRTIIHPSLSR